MKIQEIKAHLESMPYEDLLEGIQLYQEDTRAGVQKLCTQFMKRLEKYQKECELWESKRLFDAVFCDERKKLVGVDEVGRGPLAGPVVAAAVILPQQCQLLGLRDSKKLSEEQREALYDQIIESAEYVAVGVVEAEVIDEINILQATFTAMRTAIQSLNTPYDVICVDGDKCIPQIEGTQHAIIQGDDKSAAIAAASVIAKVTRDRMMQAHAQTYPVYHWESNKGYGSSKHYEAIRLHGITPLHRKTFLKKEGYCD